MRTCGRDIAATRRKGKSPWSGGQGRSPPESVSLWAFECQKETANLPTFLYFANSVVQKSAVIHYIAAAQYSVYRCISLSVNQYSSWGVFCCRWRVACPSDHLTSRNLGLDILLKTAQVIADFPPTTLQFPDFSRFSLWVVNLYLVVC